LPRLYICTVGGSPEPIVAALSAQRPDRVVFVVSPDSRGQTEQIRDRLDPPLAAGAWAVTEVGDPQDLSVCVQAMREQLEPEVAAWWARGPDHEVAVDFTGGTKCMSAAVALVARPWRRLHFVYVGGSRRTNDGLGVVVSGSERVLMDRNPWDSLGYQAVEDAVVLFDQRAPRAAAQLLGRARTAANEPSVRRELATLEQCFGAYAEWDAFRHAAARQGLVDARKNANDLRHLFGGPRAGQLLAEIEGHLAFLAGFGESETPAPALVWDLLANALRRAETGAFDDAVARLYRAVEALGQVALAQEYGIDASAVPAERLSPALRQALAAPEPPVVEPAATADGRAKGVPTATGYKLGLQQVYALLAAWGHPLGQRFKEQGLDSDRSPLATRNRSILAHGFAPVTRETYTALKERVFALAGLTAEDDRLPRFPRFGREAPEG
jgi:CRISPR-associated protein (TIGR02710 family)